MRVAVIDVGTNTTRLLVAEAATGASFRDLDRRLVFTRLGAGVDTRGSLSPEAIERTLRAVAEFCAECGELSVERIRVAGTSALRDASNSDEFAVGVASLAGSELEILSGTDEARLSFIGATQDLGGGSFLVCDIGGGSTELVLGRGGDISAEESLDIGSVRLTERHVASDPPAVEEMLLLEAAIDAALDTVRERFPQVSDTRLIGVAGTITTLAAMHLALERYDPEATHGLELALSDVRKQYRRVAGMTFDDRKKVPGMPEGRADVIVAGAAILTRLMTVWGFESVTVSEKDILDGLVLDMLRNS